jgi:hypothetical protein
MATVRSVLQTFSALLGAWALASGIRRTVQPREHD